MYLYCIVRVLHLSLIHIYMFAQEDLSSVNEVLLWRRYDYNLVHPNVNVYASWGNNGVGVTRSFVNNFLMADGTPVYTHGDYTVSYTHLYEADD